MRGILIEVLKAYKEICLCGDGRKNSPGHSARYCVYTLMEHATKAVIDLEVLDKREAGGNSKVTEKQGLRRLLKRLLGELPLGELCTDASSTIMKLVRDMKGEGNVLFCFGLAKPLGGFLCFVHSTACIFFLYFWKFICKKLHRVKPLDMRVANLFIN